MLFSPKVIGLSPGSVELTGLLVTTSSGKPANGRWYQLMTPRIGQVFGSEINGIVDGHERAYSMVVVDVVNYE